MSINDPRYKPLDALWFSVKVPPITRVEAQRAVFLLLRHFGKARDAGVPRLANLTEARVRTCWVTRKPSTYKGWERLAHDLSHRIFRYRHPSFRPHDGGHARLEREVAEYIIAQGWLSGSLKPQLKPKPNATEKRAALALRLKKWQTKRNRADTAIRKLRASIKRYDRLLTSAQSAATIVSEPGHNGAALGG